MRPIIAAALAFVALAGAGAQETGSVPAGRPDAIVDLATPDGARIVRGTWRYHDAAIVPIDLTYDVAPHAGTADFDAAAWEPFAPDALDARRGGGLARGWNAPNRVSVARDVRPGETFQVAVFGANAPLSDPPANFVWIRSATV